MFLKELQIFQFKNIDELTFSFSEQINFLCGRNGVGKTSVLDAIHYLSLTKSFLNSSDTENISYNKDFFRLQGKYLSQQEMMEYSCIVTKESKKQFKYFQKEYSRLQDHIGKVPLLIISPHDQLFIIEGSELRRKLIDGMISQMNGEYLHALVEYNKILKQRNSLLKSEQEDKIKYELLEIYDNQLIKPCNLIYQQRKNFLHQLLNEFTEQYAVLVNNKNERAFFNYKSQLNEESFETLLLKNREKDVLTSYSNVGIHKDDVLFLLNNMPLRYFASQGQQKSFITAFKLSYVQLLLKSNKQPIILLDDVFDKLDDDRVMQLIKIISNSTCQTFITHTSKEKIQWLANALSEKVSIFELDIRQ